MEEQRGQQEVSMLPGRPRWTSGPMLVLYAMILAAAAIALAAAAGPIAAAAAPESPEAAGAWLVLVVCWVVAFLCGFWATVFLIMGVARWVAFSVMVPRINEMLDQVVLANQRLEILGERVLMSDAAKRVGARHDEGQALRQAIKGDLSQRDFDSALVLIKQLGEVYGYREEAEQLREQVTQAQEADAGRKIEQAIGRLDALLKQYSWDRAYAEVARIQRMFPDSPRIVRLDERVKKAYDARKHDLERQFLTAAQRDDVDVAMELLRELDKYLSEEEAEPFRETARGVIGKKRDNLGVQFKLAVQDREWSRALEVGQQIIREFPNTKMAQEVREMMDLLRQRVGGVGRGV